MEVINGLESFPKQRVPVVVALGTFDGLHLGHQALLALAVQRARDVQGRCAVFTFDPHPRTVLTASPDGFLLTTLDERLELFAMLGADLAVVVQFTATFRYTSAETWIRELVTRTAMAEVVCGANYVFGRDARSAAGGYPPAVSIGVRPTFGQGPLVVEAYLLRFAGDLYGMPLELHLAARLHDELMFSSVEDLVRQIGADVAAVPRALAEAEERTGLGPRAWGLVGQTSVGKPETRTPKPEAR